MILKMKKLLFVSVIFIMATALEAQEKTKSGLLIGGGKGFLSNRLTSNIEYFESNYKYNISIGYRFRVYPTTKPSLFLDLDANLGAKSWYTYAKEYNKYNPDELTNPYSYSPILASMKSIYFFSSVASTINYTLYKRLSLGIGLEPTYFFFTSDEKKIRNFDLPAVAKIGYNFRFLEIGLTYKHGLMKVLQDKQYLLSGQFRDWQISIWIPF